MVYAAGSGPAIGRYPDWSPELALEVMDKFEVETALMSLGQPGVQFCKPAEAKTLARRCNDYSAELNAKHGKRFGAFGTISMWNVADAVEEVGYCLDTLKFPGVSLFASYDGKFLGDSKFDPVMEALNARDGVVFVHPGSHPSNKQIDLPWPYFMMEYLFTTDAGGGEPHLRRRAGALSAHPVHPAARRRARAVFLLAAVGVANDRQAAADQMPQEKIFDAAAGSGTTTRCRPARRPGAAWRMSRRRIRSCSAPTGHSPTCA